MRRPRTLSGAALCCAAAVVSRTSAFIAPASLGREAATSTHVLHRSSRRRPLTSQHQMSIAEAASGGKSIVTKPWLTRAQETVDQTSVRALYVRHILVQSEEMARTCLDQLRAGVDFEQLAGAVSDCGATRAKGGQVGWMSPNDDHLDDTVPRAAREAVFGRYKPGDVALVTSERGVHLIKVEDVMTDLNARRRSRGRLPGSGIQMTPLQSLQGNLEAGTYYVETMGCQMNVADTERMEGQLLDLGLTRAESKEKANVVVLNTCTIRDHAEQKVYAHVGSTAARKHRGEDVAIVVAGCVAQQEGEALLRRVPEIDLVMGPQYANRLGDLLEDVLNGNQVVATDPTLIMEDQSRPRRGSETSAWVNIIYGCNEHCTYCVVPNARGVEMSRPKEAIRKEMEQLAEAGYREVTLLGQNVDAYGRDMSPKQTFADLLHFVSDVPGIERVRFLTSHPRYMSERVVEAVATLPTLCETFHVPFQSGSDAVLRAMRRGYSVESYLAMINRIQRLVPDAAICGDVIVGFPGETEEQFEETLALMRRVRFDNLNTFAYSPRPNTEAADWSEQVLEDVKSDRLQRVQRLALTHAAERSARYLGRTVEVLVEERNAKMPGQVMGRNRQNRPVFFDGSIAELKGKLVPVKITEARPWSLSGEQDGPAR